jgi:hypothetical protein
MTYMHKTELGSLKSMLEWAVVFPGREWMVEGYRIIRRRDGYRDVYQIDRAGIGGGRIPERSSLTEAFRWVAEQMNLPPIEKSAEEKS